jgi:hypothetical protein
MDFYGVCQSQVVCAKKKEVVGDQMDWQQFNSECEACKSYDILYYEKGECYRGFL